MSERQSSEHGLKMKRMTGKSNPLKKGGQMQNLLGEFKGLYEGKLKRLDDAERAGEDINKVSLFQLPRQRSGF